MNSASVQDFRGPLKEISNVQNWSLSMHPLCFVEKPNQKKLVAWGGGGGRGGVGLKLGHVSGGIIWQNRA
jgi:hypothetical protein